MDPNDLPDPAPIAKSDNNENATAMNLFAPDPNGGSEVSRLLFVFLYNVNKLVWYILSVVYVWGCLYEYLMYEFRIFSLDNLSSLRRFS